MSTALKALASSLINTDYPLKVNTHKPLYNTVHYNTIWDITQFKDGFQKCIGYGHFSILSVHFLFGYNMLLYQQCYKEVLVYNFLQINQLP